MVNGLILRKFDEQIILFENILTKYLKLPQKIIESKEINRGIEDISRIKIIHIVKTQHSKGISSLCILKDRRLVSCSLDGSITVYNETYQPQIHIKKAHNYGISSICVLRENELVSASYKEIRIWRINEINYELIQTIKGHNSWINQVIELKDGKLCSCSNDGTIRVWDNKDNYQCVKTFRENIMTVALIIEMNNYIISASLVNQSINLSSSFFFSYTTFNETGQLMVWDESRDECVKTIEIFYGCSFSALTKLNDNALLVGYNDKICIVNIESSKVNEIKVKSFGIIRCLKVLKNELVLVGNEKGEICCYALLSNKIIFEKSFHHGKVLCLIGTEDNKIISCSDDKTINIYS